jgi:hypothetical protein
LGGDKYFNARHVVSSLGSGFAVPVSRETTVARGENHEERDDDDVP